MRVDIRRPGRVVCTIIGVAAGALIAGGVAVAAIPDSGTALIHSCINNKTGIVRVIDPSTGARCVPSGLLAESALAWNQTGPAGMNGATGSGVVNTPEPPGTNCAYGGTRFVVVGNPATFACSADQQGSAEILALGSRIDGLTADLQDETQTRAVVDDALSQTFANAATALNPEELDALQADVQTQIASTQDELNSTEDAILQRAMERDLKSEQMLGNILKTMHDTATAITQNSK